MTTTTLPHWSAVSGGTARLGRRDLLILTAGAAAALIAGTMPAMRPAATQLSPHQFVRALSKTRWGWQVELAVLQRLAVADLAFDLGQTEDARAALGEALEITKRLISEWGTEADDLTLSIARAETRP